MSSAQKMNNHDGKPRKQRKVKKEQTTPYSRPTTSTDKAPALWTQLSPEKQEVVRQMKIYIRDMHNLKAEPFTAAKSVDSVKIANDIHMVGVTVLFRYLQTLDDLGVTLRETLLGDV